MEGNPPFQGLNWVNGIELALRVISLGLSLSIVGVNRLDEVRGSKSLDFSSRTSIGCAAFHRCTRRRTIIESLSYQGS